MTTWKARPTTYKGIQMRSRLEARMAAHLDLGGEPWEYEPRAFANEDGQYLPDFYIEPKESFPYPIYIEVKPTLAAAEAVRERMEIILDSEPGAWLMVVIASEDIFLFRDPRTGDWRRSAWEWLT